MQGYSEQEKYWIWLGSVTSPKLFYYIMKEFGDAERFFDAVDTGSEMLNRIPEKALAAIRSACSKQRVAEAVCELAGKSIRAVTRLSDEYPVLLTEISYPPPVLYVRGSLYGAGKGGQYRRHAAVHP